MIFFIRHTQRRFNVVDPNVEENPPRYHGAYLPFIYFNEVCSSRAMSEFLYSSLINEEYDVKQSGNKKYGYFSQRKLTYFGCEIERG